MNSTQDHTISRRKQKKAAEKLMRAQLNIESRRKEVDAAIRKSRAARLHRIMRRPGRGGLSANGAEQLRQHFSKKVPESEKPTLREMDPTAFMTISQMASEEVDARGSNGKWALTTPENLVVRGEGEGADEGGERGGKGKMQGEEMEVEAKVEVEEGEELGENDEEQGGVVLAYEL